MVPRGFHQFRHGKERGLQPTDIGGPDARSAVAEADVVPTPWLMFVALSFKVENIAARGYVSTGERRGRPCRSITTETLTKMAGPLDQLYKCCVCNPGKCPDTQRMVFASRPGSRDIAHDRYLCIAVEWCEPPQG